MQFDNTYAALPGKFHAAVLPAPAPAPQLLAWNGELAADLGLGGIDEDETLLARVFSGSESLPGSQPVALAYAGHQFGNFVPQLGDGRALLLGEVLAPPDGKRFDIQLKGSGRTPFSRNGDGKAAIGPVLREFLLSEYMHRVGIPTTRALAAVATGETVFREERLPGAILTRVAASHIRVGTFEFFAARQDVDSLRLLADYAIRRHYPDAAGDDHPYPAFLALVARAQARLIADWMAVGFIHGVMNTDNMSIAGETIDYGPCAFMDEFDYHKVFSSIDRFGRYAYGRQATIGHWNLGRLADCLMMLDQDKQAFEDALGEFESTFERRFMTNMATKLGLTELREDDPNLLTAWLQHMQDNALDFTLAFRRLAERCGASDERAFGEFETRWRARLAQQEASPDETAKAMNAVNPVIIPRNHRVEEVIGAAEQGDMSIFNEMREALGRPFSQDSRYARYAEPPAPSERVEHTFCGT